MLVILNIYDEEENTSFFLYKFKEYMNIMLVQKNI